MRRVSIFIFFLSCIATAVAQDNYSLSGESSLTIMGTSTVHEWTVKANSLNGELATDGKTLTKMSFEVLTSDIISERGAAMDKKMHKALKSEQHPNVKFNGIEVGVSKDGNTNLRGVLSVAGFDKEVDVFVAKSQTNDDILVKGLYKITLQDYEIVPPTAMFGSIVVGDEVTVNFSLVFNKN